MIIVLRAKLGVARSRIWRVGFRKITSTIEKTKNLEDKMKMCVIFPKTTKKVKQKRQVNIQYEKIYQSKGENLDFTYKMYN